MVVGFYQMHIQNYFLQAFQWQPLNLSYENRILQKTEIPLYAIQGELVELFAFTYTESYEELSVNAGSDITLLKAVGLTPLVACDYVPYLKDAIEWLKTSVWN